jgi:hypothetical protein
MLTGKRCLPRDTSTKTKAIRLVRWHAGDYSTNQAAIRAVTGRLKMSAEPHLCIGIALPLARRTTVHVRRDPIAAPTDQPRRSAATGAGDQSPISHAL